LYAEIWNINVAQPLDGNHIAQVVSAMHVPEFVPKSKRIETDESVKKEEGVAKEQSAAPLDDLDSMMQDVAKFFQSNPVQNIAKLKPIDFEKDDGRRSSIEECSLLFISYLLQTPIITLTTLLRWQTFVLECIPFPKWSG
jgi:hypothetical protein